MAGSSSLLLPGDPSGPSLPGPRWLPSPSWYMCTQLWWLDVVLNNKLLKECEQCVSHTLAEPIPKSVLAAAAPLLISDFRVGPISF